MEEKWILDTLCGGVTQHIVGNVLDELNDEKQPTINLSIHTILNFQE